MEISLAESYEFCKQLTRQTAGNFYFSFLTLPPECFRAMCALYGFMRISDDIGDDPSFSLEEKRLRLLQWRASLENALNGDVAGHEIFPALSEIVNRYQIPAEYLRAVLDGIESDLTPRVFETFDDLSQYCYQVAGAVGLCCIHIWGFHDEHAIGRAVDCGIAFQLTNILRDLAEDAEMGRVYLPQQDLRRFHLEKRDLLDQCQDARFLNLMEFQVERTRSYYRKAEELSDMLDRPGKPVFAAMMKIYSGLLSEIQRRNYDVYTKRVSLSRWRKLRISVGAILRHRVLSRQ
ncbi:MAG: phytoene/squalene synthase family protein [Planctomycetaceae bacterium]